MDNLIINRNSSGVVRMTMNRPDVHNAFDDVFIGQLLQQLQQLANDPDIRVLILTGNGKSFSAGADLNWMRKMASYSEEENYKDSLQLAELMYQLDQFPTPVIALVNGNAFGGGVGLIACCDIAIANTGCQFALTEVKLGLVPAVISPYVAAAIGERQCRRYMLTGEPFDADTAMRIGLIHESLDEDQLEESVGDLVTSLAKRITGNGPNAVRACKQLIRALSGRSDLREQTADLIAKLRVSEEGQEGLTAFLDKRDPDYV